MAKKKRSRMEFPWESRNEQPEASDAAGESSTGDGGDDAQPPAAEPPAFPPESTNEYDMETAWQKSSARSEIAMDAPVAVEDTREVEVPRSLPRRGPSAPVRDEPAPWEAQPRMAGRLRRWLYSDPAVRWFLTQPRQRRRTIALMFWTVFASAMVVGVFLFSVEGLHPAVMAYVRPIFAPKPERPVRTTPRDGHAIDLVEDRRASADEFRYATDCVWLTPDPEAALQLDADGLELWTAQGAAVASLDLRTNWDGLLRIYFGAGKIPVDEPLYIKVPILGGGMWTVARDPAYRVLALGGPVPSYYLVGPVYFTE